MKKFKLLLNLFIGIQVVSLSAMTQPHKTLTLDFSALNYDNYRKQQPAETVFPLLRYHKEPTAHLVWASESLNVSLTDNGTIPPSEQALGYVNFGYYTTPQQNITDFDGYIYELYVQPEYRKLGLGTHLFTKALACMERHGCKKIIWKAKPFEEHGLAEMSQEELNAFYEHRGAQQDHSAETAHKTSVIFTYDAEKDHPDKNFDPSRAKA